MSSAATGALVPGETDALRPWQVETVTFELRSRYTPEKMVGKGAFGAVISVKDSVSGERRAVKKLTNVLEHPLRAKQTLREIVISRQMDHECFLEIHDVFQSKNGRDLYLVMDLMDYDLHKVIYCSKEPQSIEQIQFFTYEILRGLLFMHGRGVMHRDLKPGNVFVDKNCDTKIGDLGMARVIDAAAVRSHDIFMTEYIATRWYRAPEILMWNAYGFEVDIWSIGVILGELLLRRPLFPGENVLSMISLFSALLGTPSPEFLQRINARSKVATWLKAQPFKARRDFTGVFPLGTDAKALDLLDKLLVYSPYKRLSVVAAMRHPFFGTFHREEYVTEVGESPMAQRIEYPHFIDDSRQTAVSTSQLQLEIARECARYRKRPESPRRSSVTTHPNSGLQTDADGDATMHSAAAESSAKPATWKV